MVNLDTRVVSHYEVGVYGIISWEFYSENFIIARQTIAQHFSCSPVATFNCTLTADSNRGRSLHSPEALTMCYSCIVAFWNDILFRHITLFASRFVFWCKRSNSLQTMGFLSILIWFHQRCLLGIVLACSLSWPSRMACIRFPFRSCP